MACVGAVLAGVAILVAWATHWRATTFAVRHPVVALRISREFARTGDPWCNVPARVHHRVFGSASLNPFSWYRERPSRINARNVAEVCGFLSDCRYMTDRAQFGRPDFWQHPSVFEKRKRGDCDDFALWAWRKLCEAGIDAEFTVGCWHQSYKPEVARVNHAWVVYRENGECFLLETTERSRRNMVYPLAEVRSEYTPHLAVNREGMTRVYGGIVMEKTVAITVAQPKTSAA